MNAREATNSGAPRRRRPWLACAAAVLAMWLAGGSGTRLDAAETQAQGKGATAGGAGEAGPGLAGREQELSRQFHELERTFLRLADLLAPSDPRRAAVLRGVFEQARQAEVGDRLDTIVGLLEKGQLLKAGTDQSGVLNELRQLLAALEAGDSDRRLASDKEEVRQFLGRVTKLIARQRDVEGATEAGAKETPLGDRQAGLADDARSLAGDVDSFAKRMDPKEGAADEKTAGKSGGDVEAGDEEADKPGTDKPGTDKPGADGSPEGSRGSDDDRAADKNSGAGESSGRGESDEGDPEATESPAGEQGDKPEDQGDSEPARARRTRNRLAAAERRMRQAQERLAEANRREARKEQEKAVEELEAARAELEEILRQMREQEVERTLVQLEARLRAMLRVQRGVLAGAEKLAAEESQADRERQLEAVRLSREQQGVGTDAAKALALVRDDGSAVAMPEALEQVRDDSAQAVTRLARGDVGGTTRGILQDLVTGLEEMLATLEKAQREQKARQQGNQGGRPGEPGEQPLVDRLAELKMIRALQMRVNTRTKRFSQLLVEGEERAEQPELRDALERLAERQWKIERAAHDIVTGRTE